MKTSIRMTVLLALALPWTLVHGQQTPAASTQQQQTDQDSGPNSNAGPIVIPKKKEEDAAPPPAPAAPKTKNPDGATFSMRVDVPIVSLDVNVILDKTHQFVPGLKTGNFVVLEDGVEQKVDTVRVTQTPITAVLLLEFAANCFYCYNIRDMQNTAVAFFRSMKPDDYVAVMTYDLHTEILTDFTNNQQVIAEALRSLTVPMFSDTDMFDALYETLDRVSRIEGRKYIILVGTGVDTFSKITLDKILAKVKATPNVTIFTIATGQLARQLSDRGDMASGMRNLTFIQAQNELQTFSRMTGGMFFAPLFATELPDDFAAINNSIRNQYVITYHPTNSANDGTYRKVKVYLVDSEGKQLRMQDEKGKALKYTIIARDGYTAKRPVE